jgi:5-carboxymethyl-2-hydroxymuconic-semialdehyde dehydrogenase
MSKAALRGAANFRYFADQAPYGRDGESTFTDSQTNMTMRFPIGPVGIITPWNTPFMLSTWKIAPALASGCTIVHKPAELSPLTAKILVEIAEDAGLPKGVWNTVNGYGEEAGKLLTEHPDIKAISFVGESATGSMIMKQGANTLKRVHFELGGKNAVVVFEDADLERAADAVVFMIYSLNGERCTSSSRLLVQESIREKFVEMVKQRAEKIVVGHPLDPNTTVGPLIHPIHEEKVKNYFEIGKNEGATLLTGGSVEGPGGGPYIAPTIFTNVSKNMRIAKEEIFGPVLVVLPFESETEALDIVNDSEYGLAGYLWTQNVTRAFQFSQSMEAGMIWVNSENIRHLPTPFGGIKSSGIGRDGGDWSFDFYMETKNISFATTEHKIPKLGV